MNGLVYGIVKQIKLKLPYTDNIVQLTIRFYMICHATINLIAWKPK